MAISIAQARQICTKAELELVLQSTTRQIGELDAKQLRAAVRRARTMRDKWRDVANAQTRETKAADPGNLDNANARSDQKAELFDEALTRFEKRLTKLDASTNGSGTGERAKKPSKQDAASKPAGASKKSAASKKNAVAEKSSTRTAKPSAGKESSAELEKKAATKTPGTSNAPVSPKTPTSSKTPASKKAAPKKALPKRRTAPKRQAAPQAATGGATGPAQPPIHGLAAAAMAAGRDATGIGDKPTGAEKKRNLKAKAAAKATAVSRSGAPRIQGHVSSQGRRNQAKRSSR